MPTLRLGHLLLAALLPACALDGAITDERSIDAPGTIGDFANGTQLNGVRLNGVRLNGVRLNGVRLNGVRLNGTALNGVRLNGSQLTGADGTTQLTGAMMIGSQLSGLVSDGTTVTLRVDDAHTLAAPDDDVWSYKISFQDSAQWLPICTDKNGAAVEALALAGTWDYGDGVVGGGAHTDDPTTFTLACRGIGAIAKCVEMGYKPWATVSGYPLAPFHQACTRMVRADYCGDGHANTVDGTAINVYDKLNIQTDSEAWLINAEWRPDGAVCVSPSAQMISYTRPTSSVTCRPAGSGCGSSGHFLTGTLLMNEAKAFGSSPGAVVLPPAQ